MDWLKDKKNMPFVIAGASLLIVGAIVFLLFQNGVFGTSNPTPAGPVSTALPAPAQGLPPGGPGLPPGAPAPAVGVAAVPSGGPGMPPPRPALSGRGRTLMPPGTTASAAPAVSAAPAADTAGVLQPINPATVRDPFAVPMLAKSKLVANVTKAIANSLPPLRTSLPDQDIYQGVSAESQLPPTQRTITPLPGLNSPYQVASLPRVSGVVIVNQNGIHAIIQSADGSQSVNPGDDIGGVGRVMSIQPDGITVKTNGGQSINIPVSAGNPINRGYPGGPPYGGGGYPGNPRFGGGRGRFGGGGRRFGG